MSNEIVGPRLAPERRREQIIEIAATHFARDGAAAASMSAIARDAGVTRALVYHYFPGKESLLDAVWQREADRLLAATAPAQGASEQENLRRALTAYFDHFAASAGGVRELYMPSAPPTSSSARLATANHAVQVQRLLEATGTPDTPPQSRLALGAWLAFVEFTARHAEDSEEIDREPALDLCIGAVETVLGRPLAP